MRKRIRTILLFPVLAFLFIIGWVLYWVGKQEKNTEKEPQSKPSNIAKDAEETEEEFIEVGLMEELEEEQVTAE